MDNMTDEVLFQMFREEGDELALAKLYERYVGPLRRYITCRIRCELTVDELIQATFVNVVRYKDNFETGKTFRPWIYTIADRLTKNHLKSAAIRRQKVLLFTDYKKETQAKARDSKDNDFMEDRKSKPTPEEMEKVELGRKAMVLLNKLPPGLRLCVKLSIINGLPSRAIGPLINVSYRQAQNRLKAALDILRKQLESDSIEDVEEPVDSTAVQELLDTLPEDECLALERVLDEQADQEDSTVFSTLVRRLAGEIV